MRRFELTASRRAVIDRPSAEVLELLTDLPEILALFPAPASARELEPPSRYALELGPFGVGGFRGTVRAEVRIERGSTRRVSVESTPGAGNTDLRARFDVEPAASGGEIESSRLSVELWASPRREVPAFLPLSLVQRAAHRTVERGLAEALRLLKRRLETGL